MTAGDDPPGTPEWNAERTVPVEVAAEVIAAQFPELAGLPVRAFGAGWDNVVLAVGQEWLFRFIHRSVALDGARRELAVLRHLANPFTLPIPFPEKVGTPTPRIGWPFWGTRALSGRELAVAGLPDDARVAAASAVGAFLRELHDPALARRTVAGVGRQGVVLPVDPLRRGDAAAVARRAQGRLDRLVQQQLWAPDPGTTDLLREAATLGPPTGPPVLVHGDLHVRHVLVVPDGRATGVIDWGDTALADPAVDLMIGYTAFSGRAREAFLAAYGPLDGARELRARVLGVHVNAVLTEYASAEGLRELAAEALLGMARAVR